MVRPLKVLFLSAEAEPLAKVGGLGDVGGELPRALRRAGHNVRLCLPRYPSIDAGVRTTRSHTVVEVDRRGTPVRAVVRRHVVRNVDVLLVDGEPVARHTGIYGGDEGEKFIFWCLAALEACRQRGWQPDVVHAHDWHAAAAVAWIHAQRADPFWSSVATVFTIHNLGYAGAGAEEAWRAYGLGPAEGDGVPAWAVDLPLVSALTKADWLTTVSPGYADEITTAELGFGLDPILKGRRSRLTGILNGIDPTVWNPAADHALVARFDADGLEHRVRNKQALLSELGFTGGSDIPLLAFIGRMDHQKGIDLLLHALATMLDLPWQAVLLGTGDPELEAQAASFQQGHLGRFRAEIRFDAALARRIYGSADAVVIPSRYEPCGLVQMIAMRYGCLPVVRSTGGLRDSVRDAAEPGGTGFVFGEASVDGLADALRRALATYADRRAWRRLQRRAARKDFSWTKPARKYGTVYRKARALRRSRRR